jgi:hypothetical protein
MKPPKKTSRHDHERLAGECAKLDPAEEKALAEEGMGDELAHWPPYDAANTPTGRKKGAKPFSDKSF